MIRLGAFDWRHVSWQGVFYPEDLPEDWQLTYYANVFDAVGLPAQAWLTPSLEVLGAWVADTRPHFRFYLEVPRKLTANLEARLEVLRPRLGGLLVSSGGELEGLRGYAPVWDTDTTPWSGRLAVAHHWEEAGMPGRAPLVLLTPQAAMDLRAARRVMEMLGPQDGVLLLLGPQPEFAKLQALMSLRDLLGWQGA